MLSGKLLSAASVATTTVTYHGSASDTNDASSYTFSSVLTGIPTGLVVVVVHIGSNVSAGVLLNSITIGGVAGTIHSNIQGRDCAFLASAVVTGASSSVSVTFSGLATRCQVSAFSIANNSSSTPVEVKDTYSTAASSRSITFTDSGVGVGVFGVTGGIGGGSFTWTNATEQYEVNLEGGSDAGGALRSYSAVAGTVSVSYSGSDRMYLSGAFWR